MSKYEFLKKQFDEIKAREKADAEQDGYLRGVEAAAAVVSRMIQCEIKSGREMTMAILTQAEHRIRALTI